MLNVLRPGQIGAKKGVKYFIISNHVKLIITDIEVKSFFAKSLMYVCVFGFFFCDKHNCSFSRVENHTIAFAQNVKVG